MSYATFASETLPLEFFLSFFVTHVIFERNQTRKFCSSSPNSLFPSIQISWIFSTLFVNWENCLMVRLSQIRKYLIKCMLIIHSGMGLFKVTSFIIQKFINATKMRMSMLQHFSLTVTFPSSFLQSCMFVWNIVPWATPENEVWTCFTVKSEVTTEVEALKSECQTFGKAKENQLRHKHLVPN